MGYGAPCFLDRVLHHVARALVVAQARGENLPERRVLRELLEHFLAHPLLLVGGEHLVEQVSRDDPVLAENHEPLDDERYGDDRYGEEKIDRPACGLDDGEQQLLRIKQKNALTLACDHGFGKAKKFKNIRPSRMHEPRRSLFFRTMRANPPPKPYPQILWIRLCIRIEARA